MTVVEQTYKPIIVPEAVLKELLLVEFGGKRRTSANAS